MIWRNVHNLERFVFWIVQRPSLQSITQESDLVHLGPTSTNHTTTSQGKCARYYSVCNHRPMTIQLSFQGESSKVWLILPLIPISLSNTNLSVGMSEGSHAYHPNYNFAASSPHCTPFLLITLDLLEYIDYKYNLILEVRYLFGLVITFTHNFNYHT